jgi:hypothetical protein
MVVVLLALAFGVGRLSAAPGTLDSPAPPGSTSSYGLEDIYNRLNDGTAGTQSTFTEPTSGPTVGTGHTLNEIVAAAPQVDDTNGATQAHVLGGKTFWGLTSGQWGPMTGSAAAAPVAKTGQTTSYVIGDDGYLEKGMAWPNPRFTDYGDGTVTDNLTGLIWLRNANCWGTQSWVNALIYANSLTSGSCGLSDGSQAGDWRLANVRELQSLFHYGGVHDPPVPNAAGTGQWTEGNPFTGIQSDYYWSSTTHAVYSDAVWGLHLYDGHGEAHNKALLSYVWPVRGGQ